MVASRALILPFTQIPIAFSPLAKVEEAPGLVNRTLLIEVALLNLTIIQTPSPVTIR